MTSAIHGAALTLQRWTISLLCGVMRVWQLISASFGHACRFHPSCSEYARISLERHGLVKGLGLTLKRLGKCHPWGSSGIDNPPE